MDAASQMFFTLSLGFGALISFASYMPLKNNCIRDAYTVVFINCGTSLFAGIVVFSILGHRELVTGNPASEVRKLIVLERRRDLYRTLFKEALNSESGSSDEKMEVLVVGNVAEENTNIRKYISMFSSAAIVSCL